MMIRVYQPCNSRSICRPICMVGSIFRGNLTHRYVGAAKDFEIGENCHPGRSELCECTLRNKLFAGRPTHSMFKRKGEPKHYLQTDGICQWGWSWSERTAILRGLFHWRNALPPGLNTFLAAVSGRQWGTQILEGRDIAFITALWFMN